LLETGADDWARNLLQPGLLAQQPTKHAQGKTVGLLLVFVIRSFAQFDFFKYIM
jgi:hypothetical protein